MNSLSKRLVAKFGNDGIHALSIAVQRLMVEWRCLRSRLLLGWHVSTMGPGIYVRGARRIQVGRNFKCRANLWVEAVTSYAGCSYAPQIVIGHNFSCGDGLHVAAIDGVTIGDHVLVGSNVLITDHSHGRYGGDGQSHPAQAPGLRPLVSLGQVHIGNNVFIGDNVCVLAGTRIGAGAILASNSVVTRDVPSNTIVAGNPAAPLKRFCEQSQGWIRI